MNRVSKMVGFVAAVAGVYLLVVALLFVFQRSLIYFPHSDVPRPADYGVAEMGPVAIETSDGLVLRAWYQPAGEGRPTIVYFCGNAGHIGYRGGKVRAYLDAGLGVLLVGYRGYGGNPGKPTEAGLYRDGAAAVAFLAGRGVPSAQTVLYGESLGSGVAVYIASRPDGPTWGALILESPFASMGAAAAAHYPFLPARWLVRDRYDSLSRIARVRAPLLIVHGEEDRTVPVAQGRSLFAAATSGKQAAWVAEAGHNDLYEYGAADVILRFIDTQFPRGNEIK